MKLFSALSALAFVGVCFGAEPKPTARDKEPTYEGKTLSQWIGLTKDKNEKVRAHAAEALGYSFAAKAVIPSLTELLKDKQWNVRYSACRALQYLGPNAEATVSVVMKLLGDKDQRVREAAVSALGNVGPAAKAAIPAITNLLGDKDELIRADAAFALGRIGPDAKTAIPALAKLVEEDNDTVRSSAGFALGAIGPTAIPTLSELLKDKDKKTRGCAAEALGAIGPEAKTAIPTIMEMLKDGDEGLREAAAYGLGEFGPEAKAAVPTLTRLLGDKSSSVRLRAADALGNIAPEAVAIPTFTELFRDKDERVREAAASAVAKIGPTAILPLVGLLNDKSKDVRTTAARSLGYIRSDAQTTIPALTGLLKDKDERVREAAASSLGNFGPDAKAASPVLAELLKDKDEGVRYAAEEALLEINSVPMPAPVASLFSDLSQQAEVKDTLPSLPADKSWRLVWHDEFDGTELNETKWEVMPDAPRRDGWWMRKAITLDGNGHLVISTLKEGDRYIDGCVRTKGKFEHSFGYYVARIQFQKQPGHWSAFWIMGDGVGKVGSGGRDGVEIDIMEKPWLDDRVQQTIHWDGYGKDHKSVGHVAKVSGIMEGWHTFGLRWKPDEYIFYVDGKETWRTKKAVSQVPEYIKLSDEIGNWGGDIAKATLPDAFLVDYVRVYDVLEK
ncbi:MAG: sister chromatid cohesion protein PDS5 [Thermoguttaceae bacterium]